ncbi:MAG TPA: tungsten ABC transporter substrate-binding protein [Deltaproteobacteria bacterium]|nr:tungsten ABC transporter substrate-binding protein [Deltaproteobacteria bacterium]
MNKTIKKYLVLFLMVSCVIGIGSYAVAAEHVLKMATTTSTDNTGLLDYLAPTFRAETGIDLRWVSVGTGKALELGKNCDVDVLLVHAPDAEMQYVADGHGVDRRQIMYNDFVFIGPKNDPCAVKGRSAMETLKTIASQKGLFASRGDNSGTHKQELILWAEAEIPVPDKEPWYIQTGQGMLNTITIASERNAYTMTDRGTFIKYEANWRGNPPLVILVEGDKSLRNQYSVIAVNPKQCSNVKYDLASKFRAWMTLPKTQQLIGDFKLLGIQLFVPNAHEK